MAFKNQTETLPIFVDNGNVTIHGDGLGSTKEFSNCSTGATGGAIYVGDGSLQINDSILDGSSAGQKSTPGRGGALAVGHGQLTLADTIIRNATAAFGDGGGIIVGEGNVALFDTLIENCTAVGSLTSLPGDGGGIFITTGSLEMTHSQLRNNSAGRDGGAVRIGAGNATVYGDSGSNVELLGNIAHRNGGAISLTTGNVSIQSSEVISSRSGTSTVSGNGGAVNIETGSITLTASQLYLNTAYGSGGAVHVGTGVGINALRSTTIYDSKSFANGGAISLDSGILSLNSVNLKTCTATGDGGAIHVGTGKILAVLAPNEFLEITDCTAGGSGGAIRLRPSMTLPADPLKTDSVLTIDNTYGARALFNNCMATSMPGSTGIQNGGALDVQFSRIDIRRAKFTDCQAERAGGAAHFFDCNTTIYQSTVSGCTAGFDGGGIWVNHIAAPPPASIESTASYFIFRESLIENCTALMYGGGLLTERSHIIIDYSTITNCKVTLEESVVSGLTSGGIGGGIFAFTGLVDQVSLLQFAFEYLEIRNSTISNCSSAYNGGGIGTGRPTIDKDGMMAIGGQVAMVISHSMISGNTSKNNGAGLLIESADGVSGILPIVEPSIVPPTDPGQGLPLVINRSTFQNNKTTGYAPDDLKHGSGGGGYVRLRGNDLVVIMQDSTFNNNHAIVTGGGLDLGINTNNTAISVINSTFSANSTLGTGGGLYFANQRSNVEIKFTTIVDNTAKLHGAGLAWGGVPDGLSTQFKIDATVISGNKLTFPDTKLEDNFYTVSNSGPPTTINNLTFVFNYSALGKHAIPATLVTQNFPVVFEYHSQLKLRPLASNGGPTQTHKPSATPINPPLPGEPFDIMGSPLINHIPTGIYDVTNGIISDQRGSARPGGADDEDIVALDVGSIEAFSDIPHVSSFIVNDGDPQRSRIVKITLNFDAPVENMGLSSYGEIRLTRTRATSAGAVGTVVQTGVRGVDDKTGVIFFTLTPISVTSLDITFKFSNTASVATTEPFIGVENFSLADGFWQLAVPSMNFTSTLNDPNLRRLYGDFDGNGIVGNSADIAAFNAALANPTNIIAFDFDNSLGLDGIDYAEFESRFGTFII